MAKSSDMIVIKKYANRRLYNTGTSTYVTLEDLAVMVKDEQNFTVVDAKSGDDITRSVLTQIIFEQEGKGQNLLPITFLRNLIQIYGDSVQSIIPSYLEHSMEAFRDQQDKFREHIAGNFGPQSAFDLIGEHTRRNTELFQNAMRMFMPFAGGGLGEAQATQSKDEPHDAGDQSKDEELAAIKQQLAAMQEKLNSLNEK